MLKRVFSLFLALILVVSFCVPVNAAYSYSSDTASRDELDTYFGYDLLADDAIFRALMDLFPIALSRKAVAWQLFNWVDSHCRETYGSHGLVSSYNELVCIADRFNVEFGLWKGSALAYYLELNSEDIVGLNSLRKNVWQLIAPFSRLQFSVTYVVSQNIYRIVCENYDITDGSLRWSAYLTDYGGGYWYYEDTSSSSGGTPAASEFYQNETTHKSGYIWVDYETANGMTNGGAVTPKTADQLANLRKWARENEDTRSDYRDLNNYKTVCNYGLNLYLAYRYYQNDGSYKDSLLCMPLEISNWYSGTEQIVTDNTDNATVNIDQGVTVLFDALNKYMVDWTGDFHYIDNVNFDLSNKSYSFSTTYNDNRSWNYHWTYNIQYTSITYIGQSEEYNETYEFYYELPDGRSSADLTAEELEQLNLQVDVINYGRSADDTRLRSLYHFDGTTDDASFWNYCTAFTWNVGASITYLESGNFGGCLYLDETAHGFTLTLPSSIGSNDFTLQFRLYQSYTASPSDDSYINFGSSTLMRFNGSSILDGSSSVLSAMPVGNWQEIAIMRSGGTVRYYLNGISIGSASVSAVLSANISFYFGSVQQTYKELDELRVLNYALTTTSYTPVSVPYDTNLSLVLPDSVVPVADEYWNVQSTKTNLLSQFNWDWWDGLHGNSGFSSPYTYFDSSLSGVQYTYSQFYATLINSNGNIQRYNEQAGSVQHKQSSNWNGLHILNNSSAYSQFEGFSVFPAVSVSRSPLSFYGLYYVGESALYAHLFDANIPTFVYQKGNIPSSNLFVVNNCLSIVLVDGTVKCVPFNTNFTYYSAPDYGLYGKGSKFRYERLAYNDDDLMVFWVFSGVQMSSSIASVRYTLGFSIVPKRDLSVVYMELVDGTETDLTAEYVSSVTLMDSSELDKATLAIKSDISVTNYQIGGVRPSIPYKGLVWAMVESGYITSLQIYDGRAWVQCDGRIWTGSRWIPYSTYNVVTLSDMYDIADASGQSGYEYIYSESGFWSWFQKAWLDFRSWTSDMLATVKSLGSGSSSSGDTTINNNTTNNYDIDIGNEQSSSVSGLMSFIATIKGLFSDDRESKEDMTDAFSSDPSNEDSAFYIWLNPEDLTIGGDSGGG